MMTSDDMTLLREFAASRSEPAFAALVQRHLGLVHSSAMRQVGDAHLAEEIAQAVFIILARKAPSLGSKTILSAWLYRATRYAAADALKARRRRQAREQEAHMQSILNAPDTDTWAQLAPLLDDAMADLGETDRAALVLRFFENKSVSEIAGALQMNESVAQRRVLRAVDKLRHWFNRRGVILSVAVLTTAISARSVQAAPANLAATISATAVKGTVLATSVTALVNGTLKTIAMTTIQKTLIAVTLVAVGTTLYEARQSLAWQTQVRALQQQPPISRNDQSQSLIGERDEAMRQLAAASDEIARLKRNNTELIKLRGEVGLLRDQTKALPATRVSILKKKLEQMPDKKIPELQFLTEKDWREAAWDADLETEDGLREAFSKLREAAENTFLNEMLKDALKKYLAANGDILPANLLQLKPYFNVPVDDTTFQHYKLLQQGKPVEHESLVTTVGWADEDYDSNHEISLSGASGGRFNRVRDEIDSAARKFADANNGQKPTEPSQLTPYLKKSIDTVIVQKYLNKLSADSLRN